MRKRLAALLLAFAMVISLCSCSLNSKPIYSAENDAKVETQLIDTTERFITACRDLDFVQLLLLADDIASIEYPGNLEKADNDDLFNFFTKDAGEDFGYLNLIYDYLKDNNPNIAFIIKDVDTSTLTVKLLVYYTNSEGFYLNYAGSGIKHFLSSLFTDTNDFENDELPLDMFQEALDSIDPRKCSSEELTLRFAKKDGITTPYVIINEWEEYADMLSAGLYTQTEEFSEFASLFGD